MSDVPRILGGRYEVGELIGRGGMAEVHIGHDTRLGRTVAIKILRSDLARDPSFQARFRREAQAAASLNHPAIVAVYDTGEDVAVEANGTVAHVPFIVMEYVEGHTVRDILRDGAAVPIEEAVEITAGVLSALEYSHHAGIVHRDIKPANVMLTPTGAVKVMDFGIARAMADAAGTMTQTQAVIGTAQYLSPEQARGEQVDSRSDLYSTGCLLFELLTGRPPFVGDSPVAVAYQHARETAQAPSAFASDVPDSLDRITMKALAKAREQRYSSAAEFRGDLETALRGGQISAPAVGASSGPSFSAGAAPAAARYGAPPAAATQVLGARTPPAPAPGPAGWAPLGIDDATRRTSGADPISPYDDDQDDETRRPWVMWVLIGVAAAAILGIVLLLTQGEPTGPPPVTQVHLPDLRGETEESARTTIGSLGLDFNRLTAQSTEVDEGLVISTDPAGPADLDPGTSVDVVISSGPTAVEIPALENFSQADARAELIDRGFDPANISTRTDHSISVVQGAVIETEPAAGQLVSPDSLITLVLSDGMVALPDLTGMSEADAQQALIALRLIPQSEPEDSDQPVGTVTRQTPGAGPVPQASPVTIFIAQEPPPEQVQVPDLFNLLEATALERLGSYSLNHRVEYVVTDQLAAGRVIDTNPPAGTSVNEGTEILVRVAQAPVVPPPAP